MNSNDQKIVRLNESRNAAKQNVKSPAPPKKIKIWYFEAGLFLALAGFADFLDWLVIGSIPVLGDVLDIIIGGIIGVWIISLMMRHYKLPLAIQLSPIAGLLIEVIPFIGDLPPTWVGVVWLIYWQSYKYKS